MQKHSAAIDETPPMPVRWAAVIALALPLVVLNCGWIANSEMKTGVTELTISTLFLGVTFLLFLITLLNLLVRRWAGPQTALSQPEMMVLYSMLSMSSVVAGVGNLGFLTPFLANPFYYQTTSNGWQSFWHLLPSLHRPARSRNPARLLSSAILRHGMLIS